MLRFRLSPPLPVRPTYTMRSHALPARIGELRRLLPGVCTLIAASTLCAQHLPAMAPTAAPGLNATGAAISASAPSGGQQRHRARVSYSGGMLEVRADDSSLNQILRDISQQTGMKVVGGVVDQRIFGVYGPAPAGTVLQTLLDGTGTNLLLKETPNHAPVELILSPQTGGATPMGPRSPEYDRTEPEPALAVPAAARPTPAPHSAGVPAIPASGIMAAPNLPAIESTSAGATSQTPEANSKVNPAASAASSATTPPIATQSTPTAGQATPSPNGVKTPQQIYQELLQMQPKTTQTPSSKKTPAAPR